VVDQIARSYINHAQLAEHASVLGVSIMVQWTDKDPALFAMARF
jgi:hypothetical protein